MSYTISWEQKGLDAETLQRFATTLEKVVDFSRVHLHTALAIVSLRSLEGAGDAFVVRAGVAHSASCETLRAPYTADVMAACVLGYEMGILSDYRVTEDIGFQEALDHVGSIVPMKTFGHQEAYIVRKKREEDARGSA